ncbi:hypothetical protein B0H10DRAFT_1963605 [Mycena sp. CBHHK59/15]|nr:hypothetical protein B0H10DRAFT_1963605 [Mycena sp. CBHHK59/15]
MEQGGDSGGGGGSKGKSDSSAEAKQGSMVVPRSGKQPVRPYKAKKSSMGPPTDAVEFDGTRVSGARPKKAGSNVESTPSETSCMGNKLPAVWLLRPEKPIGTLKFQSRPPRKLNAGSNSKKGTYENFPQQPGDDGPINGLLYNPIQGPITVAEAFEELLNRLIFAPKIEPVNHFEVLRRNPNMPGPDEFQRESNEPISRENH